MRRISTRKIKDVLAKLCVEANINLRPDIYRALTKALRRENNPRAQGILKDLLDNANYARKLKLAICQDTGLPYVFVEMGQGVSIYDGDFLKAVNRGVKKGYKAGKLRNSVIEHPLKRKARPGFSPAVVHIDMVRGSHINFTVLPKGFGSENKSAVRMFNPSATVGEICDFVVRAAKDAGPDACPPFIIGVGIGGGLDKATFLAKQALLRPIDKRNPDNLLAKLEKELLKKINRLKIGPLGLGGRTTCLGVNILSYPTHIAGLPVAVNISCHALRSATKRL